MTHSHAPAPAPGAHAGARHRRRLLVAVVLIGIFFVVELVTGLLIGSLALISDAGHMAADVVTLSAALAATVLAVRPDRSGRRSEEHTSELQSRGHLVCRLLLEKKNRAKNTK